MNRLARLGVLALWAGGGALEVRAQPALGPHKTVGQRECAGCHVDQNEWWYRDPHSLATLALQKDQPRYSRFVLIADRYEGLTAQDMATADAICMACHGTAITSKPGTLDFGISCESCHGPAERWLVPHRQGDKALGVERPGYREALGLGLRELKRLDVAAKSCTDCHYITDGGLRMAGHPDGLGWDLADQIAKVRHWSAPLAPYATLSGAFDAAIAKRGRPPRVERPVAFQAVGRRAAVRPGSARFSRRAGGGASRRPRPAAAESRGTSLDLPEFSLSPGLSPAEKLLLLSGRLDAINLELQRAQR